VAGNAAIRNSRGAARKKEALTAELEEIARESQTQGTKLNHLLTN
jgi:hypothetical protein